MNQQLNRFVFGQPISMHEIQIPSSSKKSERGCRHSMLTGIMIYFT